MKKVLAGVLATLTLVSGTVTAGAAEARDYRRHHRDRGDDHGDAIVAGIAGLAIGAALAGGGNRGYSSYGYSTPPRYYGNSYYGGNRYGNGYYAPPPRYGQGYGYAPPRYRQQCRTVSYWDPYYGRHVRQRQCW